VGEKTVEFRTALGVRECGLRFKSAIEEGRGTSAWIGGVVAKALGGETLTWYTPPTDPVFGALDHDRPDFTAGVAVPRAQGAHQNGTNVHLYVWDRGSHRDVGLLAHHSLMGGAQASKLLAAVRTELEA
jgi:hypothetical protein